MKSAEEEDPSVETLSVVVGDLKPPRSKTSPEGSPQQRCASRSSVRLTGSGVKVPLLSNFTQDWELGYLLCFTFFSIIYIYMLGKPPQTIP